MVPQGSLNSPKLNFW